jgi:4'-phosphopantetheinyl transferase EntD
MFSIASLVPAGVAVAELIDPDGAVLLPAESAALGSVSEKRRTDFTLGRECARRALRQLGLEPGPLLPGPSREPLWPAGICGSITHCDGYCAAVAARDVDVQAIGIDAERRQPLAHGILDKVAIESERAWLRVASTAMPWDVLLFSAKESVFKAWFPLVGTWIGFEHARIDFDPTTGNFAATLLPNAPGAATPCAPTTMSGRFHAERELVWTSAFISAIPPLLRSSARE